MNIPGLVNNVTEKDHIREITLFREVLYISSNLAQQSAPKYIALKIEKYTVV